MLKGNAATHKTCVAYVLRRFPKLSETFVLNEILAVEARGIAVVIFALLPTRDPRFHEDLAILKANIYYVPDLSDFRTLWRHNVRAAKRYRKPYFSALAYALKTFKPALIWRFLQSAYIADKARQCRVSHFHAHFATRATSAALLASRITHIPYSFTAHAVDIYKASVDRRALEKKINAADFVVTVSDCNRTYLQRLADGAAPRIIKVYNGVNLQRFSPNGIPPVAPFTLIAVARLVEKKGLLDLVNACGHLARRDLSFRCWIIGKGRLRGNLEALIRDLGLRDRVFVLPPHTQLEIAERYRAANLFVLPCTVAGDGNRDGLPVSIVEALASGLPVVSTAVTGIPEVVRHGENGLLVPQRDPLALAAAIESIMEDDTLYRRLRARARDSVLRDFDWQSSANQLGRLFQEVSA